MAASVIHKIQYDACGQDANKAQGKAECFIVIEAVRQVLYWHRGSVPSALFYV